MDIKTIFELTQYQNICGIKDPQLQMKTEKSIGTLKESGIDYQLRTTIVPRFHTKEIIDGLEREFSYFNY